jgi:DNA-binding PadR family transcriptional regulator
MSLKHALLGLLAEAPMSGYDLLKRFEHSLAAVWPARHNQIYTELKKMLESGLIEQVEYGARNRKLYGITEVGTEEVVRWLLAEPEVSERALRFEPLLRANFLWLLDRSDAVAFLAREEAVLRERQGWLTGQIQHLPEDIDGSVASRKQIAIIGLGLYEALGNWLADYRRVLEQEQRPRSDRKKRPKASNDGPIRISGPVTSKT